MARQIRQKKLGLRTVLLVGVPIVLIGAAWKARDLQKPVTVKLTQKSIHSRLLFERMNAEASRHPYAREISVEWSQLWMEKSGLDISTSESLHWKRGDKTLFYAADSYGWVYSHVNFAGIHILSQAHLKNHPITLPTTVHAQLRARGWTLTEHYTP